VAELGESKQLVGSKEQQLERSKQLQAKVEEEIGKGEEGKQTLYRTIKKMEVELLEKSELLKTLIS